jgi:hypothetical protein
MTSQNMKQLGNQIFEAAKGMFYEDEDLEIQSE